MPHRPYTAYSFFSTLAAMLEDSCLLHQTNYLLEQYLRRFQKDFVHHDGLRERMTKARLDFRNCPKPTDGLKTGTQ